MQTTRQQVLTRETGKGQMKGPREPISDGERVYNTLAVNGLTPYHPKDHGKVIGGLAAAVSQTEASVPMAAHRTRKALAVVLEKLVARGVLSAADLDDILLAAVDHYEPEVAERGDGSGWQRRV